MQGVDAKSLGAFCRNFPFIAWSLLGGDGCSRRCKYSKLIEELCLTGAVGSRRFRTDFLQELPTPGTGPHFDTSVPNNLTGLVGKTAYLNCRVKNLGNRTVSNGNMLVFSVFAESGDLFVSWYNSQKVQRAICVSLFRWGGWRATAHWLLPWLRNCRTAEVSHKPRKSRRFLQCNLRIRNANLADLPFHCIPAATLKSVSSLAIVVYRDLVRFFVLHSYKVTDLLLRFGTGILMLEQIISYSIQPVIGIYFCV